MIKTTIFRVVFMTHYAVSDGSNYALFIYTLYVDLSIHYTELLRTKLITISVEFFISLH